MVRKWAYVVVVLVLDFVVLCPANAQPGFLSASGVDDCMRRANSLVIEAGSTSFSPDAGWTQGAERPTFGPARSGYSPLVFFVVAVMLAFAAIMAVACCLVLGIAGICVSTEDRRQLKIVPSLLPEKLVLHLVRKTSEITSRVANG